MTVPGIGIWCPEFENEDIFCNVCGWVCGNRYPQKSMEVTQESRGRDHRMLSVLSIMKWGISRKR